ncbi:class I SAM-dependent methyltransferase [Humibacillus xanthopallidus]|uniref:class I SAM-dependent methyltransferase n=1 Tax=Humibacillus xanthopallidus TaxID=412689 RepID=UPI00384A69E1
MTDTNTISPGSPDAPDYDDFAATYAAANDTSLFNAWYTRPEMLRLAGDITGKRVLDAGCGHGPLMVALRDRGALVAGFDLSPAMIGIAQSRLGSDSDVRVADLAERLPYDDDEFDVVTCSLALHYVQHWSSALAELRRVLKPGGRLVVSIIHPFVYAFCYQDQDYFALTRYSEDHEHDGTTFTLTYWHRPLQDVINAFVDAGLVITSVTEPAAVPDTPSELLPLEGHRFICFLFFALESP